jgi:subtilisin family serine protease
MVMGITGILGFGILVLFVIGSFSFSGFAQEPPTLLVNQDTHKSGKFIPGQVIVGLDKPDSNFNEKASIHGGKVIKSLDQIKAHVVKVPINTEKNFITSMSKNPNVRYAEQDAIVTASSIPNDLYYVNQWGLERIGMEIVWSPSFDLGSGTTIAVVDTGLYYNHPDFSETNILLNIDRDFVDNDFDVEPTSSCLTFDDELNIVHKSETHSTLVTGVIAATTNNAKGVAGIGQFNILPIRVLNACGQGSASDVAAGIMYAADQGADVINLSLGVLQHQTALEDAVTHASSWNVVHDNESIVVAASGNEGDQQISYPAGYDKVISVGATAIDDTIAFYSQYGHTLDLSAPGGTPGSCNTESAILPIRTTGVTNPPNAVYSYLCVGGTSLAAPHVSGVAGLLKAANPCAVDEDIKSHLEQTAEDLGSPGRDDFFGHGLVRADTSLGSSVDRSFTCNSSGAPSMISLTGANPQIIKVDTVYSEQVDTVYSELGATASDDEDGDITDSIVIDSSSVDTTNPGSYGVTYEVTDSAENTVLVIRTVIVQDNTMPVITLVGANPQIIEVDTVYSELTWSNSI